MGSEIYPKVHENPRAFFRSPSPILLEPFAHGFSGWSLPREDCIKRERGEHEIERGKEGEKLNFEVCLTRLSFIKVTSVTHASIYSLGSFLEKLP